MKGTRPLDNDEIRRVATCFTGTFQIRNRGLFMLVVSTMPMRGQRIDASELARIYGELEPINEEPTQSDESVRDSQVNTDDTPKIFALLEGLVQDLKEQLDTATAEKAKLLELLSAEKEEKKALMPPADENPKSRNWLLRNLFGAR